MTGSLPLVGQSPPRYRSASRLLVAALALCFAASTASAETTLLVYLPAAPVESATRLGEAVGDLGAYLSTRVPDLEVAVRPFRKGEDAADHLKASGREVGLVLTESAFLIEMPDGMNVVPAFRVTRGGKETQRKMVVVASANADLKSLTDLRGHSLSLASSGSEKALLYVGRVVFDGAVVPQAWFGKVSAESDELTVAADVLYGRVDAALVSEDNPLVAGRLGKELRAVFTSQPLSLPVLAYRAGALRADQQAALEDALESLARRPEGKKILEGLRIDGFARIRDGGGRLDRTALLSLPEPETRVPEIATVSARDLGLPPLPGPDATRMPFLLGFTVPELPVPVLAEAIPRGSE
jgi:ABC-type phosphate/phosphonate transport system substrate-binding protein